MPCWVAVGVKERNRDKALDFFCELETEGSSFVVKLRESKLNDVSRALCDAK